METGQTAREKFEKMFKPYNVLSYMMEVPELTVNFIKGTAQVYSDSIYLYGVFPGHDFSAIQNSGIDNAYSNLSASMQALINYNIKPTQDQINEALAALYNIGVEVAKLTDLNESQRIKSALMYIKDVGGYYSDLAMPHLLKAFEKEAAAYYEQERASQSKSDSSAPGTANPTNNSEETPLYSIDKGVGPGGVFAGNIILGGKYKSNNDDNDLGKEDG